MCTVEKFKFSEFLLGDKNATYLFSISTFSGSMKIQMRLYRKKNFDPIVQYRAMQVWLMTVIFYG